MENLRGHKDICVEETDDYAAIEAPPVISSGDRRMQVRAYDYWKSLLNGRDLPSIQDLTPAALKEFNANSVLIDFSQEMTSPAIIYLGSALRNECGIAGQIDAVDQIPGDCLLAYLANHLGEVLTGDAPVAFEAEFTNQRGAEILSRGLLMPFSSDGTRVDFVYGVANWKEVASHSMIAGLDAQIRAALAASPAQTDDRPLWSEGLSGPVDFEPESGTLPSNESPLHPVSGLECAQQKLKKAQAMTPEKLPFDEQGLAVVVARREADGTISLVAGVDGTEKAAQRLLMAAGKLV